MAPRVGMASTTEIHGPILSRAKAALLRITCGHNILVNNEGNLIAQRLQTPAE